VVNLRACTSVVQACATGVHVKVLQKGRMCIKIQGDVRKEIAIGNNISFE